MNRVRRQTFVRGLRVCGLRLRGRERDDGASAGAHLFQEASLALHGEVKVCVAGRFEARVRVGVDRVCADVLTGLRVRELLVFVEVEIELAREDLSRVPLVHRAQVRVAARPDVLDALLLVQQAAERVAAHHVRALLGHRAAAEVELHRHLVEVGLRRLYRQRQAPQFHVRKTSRLRLLAARVRLDGYLDRAFQLKLLCLRLEHGTVGATRNVLTLECYRRGHVAHFCLHVVLDRL